MEDRAKIKRSTPGELCLVAKIQLDRVLVVYCDNDAWDAWDTHACDRRGRRTHRDLPFYAFTSLDGIEFVVVARRAEDEDRLALIRHAPVRVRDLASRIDADMYTKLQSNLVVIPQYQALQEPDEPYLNTPFALSWIQAQADNTRRLEDIRHEPPPRETLKVAQP
jgi:hypothetical protein